MLYVAAAIAVLVAAVLLNKTEAKPTNDGASPPQDLSQLGLVWLLGLIPDFFAVFRYVREDIAHYHDWGQLVLHGSVPYRDFDFQYPPYCLPWFLPLGNIDEKHLMVRAFTLEMTAIDGIIKAALLYAGFRYLTGWKRWVPFGVFTAAGIFQSYIFLRRFDLIPAAMTVAAVLLMARRSSFAAGLFLALGTGTKVYPALLIPPFLALAWREGGLRSLVLGLVAGLAPLAGLAAFMPWWTFLNLHEARGLQVESLYAGGLWLAHYAGANIAWVLAEASYEVSGPATGPVLVLAKALLATTVIASLVGVCWNARKEAHLHPADIARLSLLPVLAFVTFNFVLSPQYMIWIISLAAIAFMGRWSWPLIAILVAEALTPLIFPARSYRTGLELWRTVALNLRNVSLVLAWIGLFIETLRRRQTS